MSTRLERDGYDSVDDAAAIGLNVVHRATDFDGHRDIVHGNARKAPPATDARVLICCCRHTSGSHAFGVFRLGQEHTAQDAHPLGRPVTRIGYDNGDVPTPAGAAVTNVVNPVFNTRRAMNNPRRRRTRGWR